MQFRESSTISRDVLVEDLKSPTHFDYDNQYGYVSEQSGLIYRFFEDITKEVWLDFSKKILPFKPGYDESGLLCFLLTDQPTSLKQ